MTMSWYAQAVALSAPLQALPNFKATSFRKSAEGRKKLEYHYSATDKSCTVNIPNNNDIVYIMEE